VRPEWRQAKLRSQLDKMATQVCTVAKQYADLCVEGVFVCGVGWGGGVRMGCRQVKLRSQLDKMATQVCCLHIEYAVFHMP
jgi:hypothetical protein